MYDLFRQTGRKAMHIHPTFEALVVLIQIIASDFFTEIDMF